MSRVPRIVEGVFDISYLVVATVLGLTLVATSTNMVVMMWGVMAVVLALGDMFHLCPRVAIAMRGNNRRLSRLAAYGKVVTSITMSAFYVLLWHCGLLLFDVSYPIWTAIIYGLAVVRVIITLLPQNRWLDPTPSYKMGIWRNIPFVLQGAMVMLLFIVNSGENPIAHYVWISVLLSYAFYIPVVLYGHKNRKLGMLMLPKSIMYILIISTGFMI